jgi:pantothenate kinase-related protein Tda10
MLSQISKPADRPVIVTILGDSGLGKTTLAASFPNPIVIRAEDGLQAIPAELRPDAFPLVQKEEEVWQQIMALLQEQHDYKTVIIDSVTALER